MKRLASAKSMNRCSSKSSATLMILWACLSILCFGCKGKLSASGDNVYETKENFIQSDSVMGIYSYKSLSGVSAGTPQFVTSVTDSGGSTIAIPEVVTRPAFVFGKPSNPLLYVNRTDSSQPVPLDLFLKVYSPSAVAPDFYYEIPVFTTQALPTAITTALSWVLRWGYKQSDGVSAVYLSGDQFNQLVGQVEVSCQECIKKSASQIVQLILSNNSILSSMDAFVRSNSNNAGASTFSYNAPAVDFAYSPLSIEAGWNFSAVYTEPSDSSSTTDLSFQILLVSPDNSTQKKMPDLWTHTAYLTSANGIQSQFPNTTANPLHYALDNYSAGVHTFTGTFNSNSTAITLTTTVGAQSQSRICLNNGIISARTNRRLNTSLYYSITPTVVPGGATPAGTLTTSKVSAYDLSAIKAGSFYTITFDTTGSSPVYTVSRTAFNSSTAQYDSSTTTTVATGTYYTGNSLKFDGLAVFISGIPANGDAVAFYSPYNLSTSPAPATNGMGCFDNSTNSSSSLTFSLVSSSSCTIGGNYPALGSDSSGFTMSASGQIIWAPTVAQYQAAAPYNYLYKFCFIATDGTSTNASNLISGLIQISQDHLPTLELDSNTSYYLPIYSGQASRVNGQTNLNALPLSTTLYLEGNSLNESFMTQDVDGDPVVLSVQSVNSSPNCPSGGSNVLLDGIPSAQNFTTFAQTTSGSEVAPPSISHFRWQYLPSYNQANASGSGGNLCIRFSLSYNTNASTGGDPNLTALPLGFFDVPVTITNTMNAPNIVNSSSLSCASSGCDQNAQVYLYPQLVQNTNTSGVTQNGQAEILLSSGVARQVNGTTVNAAVMEGQYSTINIPAFASLGTSISWNGSVSSSNKQCDTLLKFDTTGLNSGFQNYLNIQVSPGTSSGASVIFNTSTTSTMTSPTTTTFNCPGATPCTFTVRPLRYFTFGTASSNTGSVVMATTNLTSNISTSLSGFSKTSSTYDLIKYGSTQATYVAVNLSNTNYTGVVDLEASTDNVNWTLLNSSLSVPTATVTVPPFVSHQGTTQDIYYRIRGFTSSSSSTSGTCSTMPSLSGSMNITAVMNPITYTLTQTSGSNSCAYLNNVLVTPMPSTTNPDYLQIKLNTVSGVQYQIPFFTNELCQFTLTAASPASSTLTTVFPITYSLYTQDVDTGVLASNTSTLNSYIQSFYGISSLLSNLQNFSTNFSAAARLYNSNTTSTYTQPLELNTSYNLLPFLETNFLDADNGVFNGFYSILNTTFAVTKGSELFFEVGRWNKANSQLNSYYFPVIVKVTGTFSGSFTFSTSSDNSTWTAASVKSFDPITGNLSTPAGLNYPGTYLVYATQSFQYLKATSTLSSGSITATVTGMLESDKSASTNPSMQVFPRSGSTVVYAYTASTGTSSLFNINMSKIYNAGQIPLALTIKDSATVKGQSSITPQFWDGVTFSGGAPVWTSYSPITVTNASENIFLQVPSNAAFFRTVSTPASLSQTLAFTLSGTFSNAKLQFQISSDGINWTNSGAAATYANSSATPPSLSLTYTTSVPLYYRIQLVSITSGSVSVTTSGLPNNFKDTLSSTAMMGNLHQPVFHTISALAGNVASGTALDPRMSFSWYCWIIDPNATPPYNDSNFTPCSDTTMGGLAVDQDGNSYFNPTLPSILDDGSNPATIAFSINSAGNGTKIKLRLVGKGYYPNSLLSPSATCGASFGDSNSGASPGQFTPYDCRDLIFVVGDNDKSGINGVTEVAAQPMVKIYSGLYSYVSPPPVSVVPVGILNPYNNSSVNPSGSSITASFDVNAGSNTSTFTAIVTPYSNRTADQNINFSVAQKQCIKVGYGTCSLDSIFKNRSAAALISDPIANPQADQVDSNGITVKMCSASLMSASSPASSNGPVNNSFSGCGYQTSTTNLPVSGYFKFQISSDPTDIKNINNLPNQYQLYSLTFSITHSSNKSSIIPSDGATEQYMVNINIKDPN